MKTRLRGLWSRITAAALCSLLSLAVFPAWSSPTELSPDPEEFRAQLRTFYQVQEKLFLELAARGKISDSERDAALARLGTALETTASMRTEDLQQLRENFVEHGATLEIPEAVVNRLLPPITEADRQQDEMPSPDGNNAGEGWDVDAEFICLEILIGLEAVCEGTPTDVWGILGHIAACTPFFIGKETCLALTEINARATEGLFNRLDTNVDVAVSSRASESTLQQVKTLAGEIKLKVFDDTRYTSDLERIAQTDTIVKEINQNETIMKSDIVPKVGQNNSWLNDETRYTDDSELKKHENNVLAAVSSVQSSVDSIQGVVTSYVPIDSVPYTIDKPGVYRLMKNLDSGPADAITIEADQVYLDLNQFTIRTSGTGVLIRSTFATVANGRLQGATYGIHNESGGGSVIRVRNLDLINCGGGVDLSGVAEVEVSGCTVKGGGTGIFVGGSEWTGRIVQNSFYELRVGAIYAQMGRGLEIRNNLLVRTGNGEYQSNALEVLGSLGGHVIADNAIQWHGRGGGGGTALYVGCPRSTIAGNTITGSQSQGLYVEGSGHWIKNNAVNNSTDTAITVGGDRNYVVGNQAVDNNGAGLLFTWGSGSAYRDNFLRGNSGGGVSGPADDLGGNVD